MTQRLGREVVIDQQVIDAPEQESPKGRVVEVGMNVEDRRGGDEPLDLPGEGVSGRVRAVRPEADRPEGRPRRLVSRAEFIGDERNGIAAGTANTKWFRVAARSQGGLT